MKLTVEKLAEIQESIKGKILPTPTGGESEDDFIARCMTDAEAVAEFTDSEQRLAVCFNQFRGRSTEFGTKSMDDLIGKDLLEIIAEDGKAPYSKPKPRKRRRRGRQRGLNMKNVVEFGGHRINTKIPRKIWTDDGQLLSKALTGSKAGDFGEMEGFAATFGNVDLQDEMIRKGAFVKSIQEQVPAGNVPMMLKHFAFGGDIMDMVGLVMDAEEDDFGLFFRGEFDGDDLSQEIRQKVVDKRIKKTSVGFQMISWEFMTIAGRTILVHTEAKFLEVTLTLRPANPFAAITSAKSMDEVRDEMIEMMKLLHVEPEQLTPDTAKKLLVDHAGGLDNAKTFCGGARGLVDVLDKLVAAMEPPQDTVDDPAGDTSGKAGADSSGVQTADLHDLRKELHARQMKAREYRVDL